MTTYDINSVTFFYSINDNDFYMRLYNVHFFVLSSKILISNELRHEMKKVFPSLAF